MVHFKPSSKDTFGSQSRSLLARVKSAARLNMPSGLEVSKKTLFGRNPVSSKISKNLIEPYPIKLSIKMDRTVSCKNSKMPIGLDNS